MNRIESCPFPTLSTMLIDLVWLNAGIGERCKALICLQIGVWLLRPTNQGVVGSNPAGRATNSCLESGGCGHCAATSLFLAGPIDQSASALEQRSAHAIRLVVGRDEFHRFQRLAQRLRQEKVSAETRDALSICAHHCLVERSVLPLQAPPLLSVAA